MSKTKLKKAVSYPNGSCDTRGVQLPFTVRIGLQMATSRMLVM